MIGLDYVSSTNSLYGVRSDEIANSSLTTEYFEFFEWEALWVPKCVARRGCGAFGRKKYVAWTCSEFLSGQMALNVRIVAVNYNNSYML